MKKLVLEYETRYQPLLSREAFVRRLAAHFLAMVLFVGVSLLAGMAGYRYREGMSWLFAGSYALYSGLAVIVAMGLILAPLLHRLLHRFHLQSDKVS